MKKNSKLAKYRFLDWSLLIPYLILCTVGILMVFSSSTYQLLISDIGVSSKAMKQGVSFFISLVAMFVVFHVNLAVFRNRKLFKIALGVSITLLLFVLILGTASGGAQRWIRIGFLSFQPSELIPLIMVLYLSANFATKDKRKPFSFKEYKKTIWVSILLIGLVVLQPNVAGGAMVAFLVAIMFLANGLSPWFTALTFGAIVTLKELATWIILSIPTSWLPDKFSYLVSRFKVMQNPFDDPVGLGFQTSNAYYAMHNGGFWGLGLGNSIQKKGYLPAADTDFIFAICIEELGLVVCLILLLLVFFLVARMYQLAVKSNVLYHMFLYVGCGTILLLQVAVNVGSLLGYIPMTGVTFPFISYGGSSMIILSIVLGLAMNARATEMRDAWILGKGHTK